MASAVPHEEEVAQSSLEKEEVAAVQEMANLSLVSSACEVVSAADPSSKESHPCLSSVCDAAEKGAQNVTQAMASCVQPHVTAVSEYAAKGLDELGEKMPLLPKPAEQILSGTKELLSSRGAEVKEAVSSRVLDVTRDTLQGSEGTATPAVTGLGPAVAQMGVLGAGAVLGTAEGGSLPTGNEELAQLAVCEEGTAALPLEQQWRHGRYFVYPTSLPEDLRLLAQLRSTARIQQLWQGMQGALAQLHGIIELVEAFKQEFNQKLQEGQEKLHQMRLDWSRKYLKESGAESPAEPEEMERLTLLMACRISQQLQLSCSGVVAAVQDLPCSLQDKLQQALHAIRELHAAFSEAHSFQDLSSSVLTQSQRELAVIPEYMEELLDYLKNNTPLSWLVGPFSPREEEEEDESSQEEEQDQSSQEEEEAGAAGAGHLETSSNPM
ncbi:perilipin-3-like [Camarhynchus parvulus]|uniref:perilipin-3-like n=1 Tax=Geospiza parvula TaxID=87175 RepID=UPI001237CE2D|nr:perilipin-3-like [Camarhynchus parvulus]